MRAEPLDVVLRGREATLAAVCAARAAAARGDGSAHTLFGEPGSGVTALLGAFAREAGAERWRVVRVDGIGGERYLPGAALDRLLRALGAARPEPGPAGYRELHRLVAAAAADSPLLCLVDDAHLLDAASRDALLYVARRLGGVRAVVVLGGRCGWAARAAPGPFADLPALPFGRLDRAAARQLLRDHTPRPAPDSVAVGVLRLAGGNPGALVEVAGLLGPAHLEGYAAAPRRLPSTSRLVAAVGETLAGLSDGARLLLLATALDPELDLDEVVSAAAQAGLGLEAVDEAVACGLAVRGSGGARPSFRPRSRLVGTILRTEAPLAEVRRAHELLAGVLEGRRHPFRGVWHRVAADPHAGPAAGDDLERAARRARRLGRPTDAARAFRRAADLADRPADRGRRLVEAAADTWLTGRPQQALVLLGDVHRPGLAAAPAARAGLLWGEMTLRSGPPALAAYDLTRLADRVADTERTIAVAAHLLAADASDIGGDGAPYLAHAASAARLGRPDDPPAVRLMLDHLTGMGHAYHGDHRRAAGSLRRVVELASVVRDAPSLIRASQAAYTLGDAAAASDLAVEALATARSTGAVTLLPWALIHAALAAVLLDKYDSAETRALEGLKLARAVGQPNCTVHHLTILALVTALRGDTAASAARLHGAADGIAARGLGRAASWRSWVLSCVDLADDRPADALDRLESLLHGAGPVHPSVPAMAAPHLVEAAVRCRQPRRADPALAIYDRWAAATDSAPRLALSHRSHGLLATGTAEAEEHFREAIRLHEDAGTPLELAKTELHFARLLRRSRHPARARELLRSSSRIFHDYRADLWAERADAELRATGENTRTVRPLLTGDLTPQQREISKLVAEGATNREIAARLFLSPRTVDHHLRNVFARLGVRSRVELASLFR